METAAAAAATAGSQEQDAMGILMEGIDLFEARSFMAKGIELACEEETKLALVLQYVAKNPLHPPGQHDFAG